MDDELRERLAVSARQRAAQLADQAQSRLGEIVAKAAMGEMRRRSVLPREYVAKLQQLVWEFGSAVADTRAAKIDQLSSEVNKKNAIIQQQAGTIAKSDAGIMSRDEAIIRRDARVRELEEEVTRLQRELTERDAQLTANSEAQRQLPSVVGGNVAVVREQRDK
jgi:uncharacterized protein (DUF3084 family)